MGEFQFPQGGSRWPFSAPSRAGTCEEAYKPPQFQLRCGLSALVAAWETDDFLSHYFSNKMSCEEPML